MIPVNGLLDVADYIVAQYTKVKVGTGGSPTSFSDSELDSFVAEKTVVPSVNRASGTISWVAEFSGSDIGNEGVAELGIFKASNDASNDTLLSRVTFTNTGVLASADTLTFTIEMEMA
tara:strand:+ start:7688 stop:8041 length:354 start_codon:yes stop_codon:yes gene_type:complete